MAASDDRSRMSEWFVPSFGPTRFRILVGLLFLPYTGMVIAFTAIGSALAETIQWYRVVAIAIIYFLALGVGAHALDALGSTFKPWGSVFSGRQLVALAVGSIAAAYGIGIYYMVREVPLLWAIAIPEGFFLLAYNLEWFSGRFHRDGWFALSWGSLPTLAGYVMQTNRVSVAAVVAAIATGLLARVEIKASRPYKALKRTDELSEAERLHVRQYEAILKSISLGVILLGAALLTWRWRG